MLASIHAREILKFDRRQVIDYLMANFDRKLTVIFDDGELVTTRRRLHFSSYFWDFHREYPQTPLLKSHHVDSVLKGSYPSDKTHRQLLTIIYKAAVEAYNLTRPEDKDPFVKLIYIVTNNIHNELPKIAEAYVESGDILDFLGIIMHPVIKNIIETTSATSDAIESAYAAALRIIQTDPSLDKNNVAKAVRAGTVNKNQITQCAVLRGFPTEVDGWILPTPVMTNYTLGMLTPYDLAAESRSAAKALYFSEAPLQDSEYFARRLQQLTCGVERIYYGDCGSQKYLHWRMSGPIVSPEGETQHPGDLQFMLGKHYLDEATGQLKTINGSETHLYGTVVKLRSPIFCQHPNKHEVCAKCFGALADNISRFSNLGNLCSGTMTKKTTQSVLSTKHLDASSKAALIGLGELSRQYLSVDKKTNGYLINKEFEKTAVRLTISRDELYGLTDIQMVEDVNQINPNRISAINYMDFNYLNNGVAIPVPLMMNQGNRSAVLTMDMIHYLRIHGWSTDERGNFVLNLDNWDFSKPIMRIPDMEYSFADHSHQIAQVIESSMKNIADRMNPHSPVSTLQELFMLTNSKLSVNIAALEVIVYANMIPSKDSVDMARNSENPVLGVSERLLFNRSLGTAFAYERQADRILDPYSYKKGTRPDSIFDVLIDPSAVLKTRYA